MSDFLVNLALRAAGVPAAASLKISAPWNEPQPFRSDTPAMEETSQEQPALNPMIAPQDARHLTTHPPTALTERTQVAPRATETEAAPASPPAFHPVPSVPEQIREIQTEHREIVREAALVPPLEVRETVREREIVREKVVEREVRAEAPPLNERPVVVPPAIQPPIVAPHDAEPTLRELIREVVVEKPTPSPPAMLAPAAPPEVRPPLRKNEAEREPVPEMAQEKERSVPTKPRKNDALELHPAKPSALPLPATPAQKSSVVQEERPVPPAVPPVLRPAPLPPVANASEAAPTQKSEKQVEVKIGTIEIRAAAPPPAPQAPEPVAARNQPVEGFDDYRAVRQYAAWFRE